MLSTFGPGTFCHQNFVLLCCNKNVICWLYLKVCIAMADAHVDLPFAAEYAKSGRASCKLCSGLIAKDSLRLAIMVQVCTFVTL